MSRWFSVIFSNIWRMYFSCMLLNHMSEIRAGGRFVCLLCVFIVARLKIASWADLVTSDHMVIKDLLTNLQALLISAKKQKMHLWCNWTSVLGAGERERSDEIMLNHFISDTQISSLKWYYYDQVSGQCDLLMSNKVHFFHSFIHVTELWQAIELTLRIYDQISDELLFDETKPRAFKIHVLMKLVLILLHVCVSSEINPMRGELSEPSVRLFVFLSAVFVLNSSQWKTIDIKKISVENNLH